MVDPPDHSDHSPNNSKGANVSRSSSLSQPAPPSSPEKSPTPRNTPKTKKEKDTAPPQLPTIKQKGTALFSSPPPPKPNDVHSTSASSPFSPLPHLPSPRFYNPNTIHPSNKSRLCNELENNNLPDVFDFQQPSNNVYSNKQMVYPPKEIGELFNELDGFEVAIFQTDWENPFGNMYKPYIRRTRPTKQNALQNAKYITAADGFSQQNIESVLQASTTKTFIATPILSGIYDNDAQNNTYAQCLTLFNALHNQAEQNHYYRGYLIVNQPDPLTTPSNINVWDYRSFVRKFHRYLTDVHIRHTYTPWLPDTTAPVTTFKDSTFPRAQGFMVLTLDTTKNFSFNPPPSLPLVDTSIQSCSHNHDSHNLLHGLSISGNTDPLTKTLERVDFLRVDIQKKHLDNGTPEDAYNFFNKHLLGRHGDTATVATKDADYGRQCFRRRPCPRGRDSDKDKDNEYWRYEITCHPHEMDELSKQLLKGNNKEASPPPLFTFPMSRSTNDNSFLIVQRKGLPTLHPLEFYDKLINTPTLTDYLLYIIMRTKFSAIININLSKSPPTPLKRCTSEMAQ